MFTTSLAPRARKPLAALSFAVAAASVALAGGCGSSGGDALTNNASPLTLSIPRPLPSTMPAATPAPVVTPAPVAGASPTPAPTPTPIVSLLPSPVASPTPAPAAVTVDTLTPGQAVITFGNPSADFTVPTDPLLPSDNGFAIGASNPALAKNGNSAQVFFADTDGGLTRGVSLVIADRNGVSQNETLPLGKVVTAVTGQNAFVLFTTRPFGDTSDAHLQQWHSANGGTLLLERLGNGQVKIRITNAQMVPYTDAGNNGQVGSFTLNGGGYSAITQ